LTSHAWKRSVRSRIRSCSLFAGPTAPGSERELAEGFAKPNQPKTESAAAAMFGDLEHPLGVLGKGK
jgi:hypothetical protein